MGTPKAISGTITLQGYIEVPKNRQAGIRAALPKHISLTRQEPGCLAFNVTENPKISGRFDVFEEFLDRHAFEAHQKRLAKSEWADISAGIPRHYTITGPQ
jgi:quinol monooxygenase YgiN